MSNTVIELRREMEFLGHQVPTVLEGKVMKVHGKAGRHWCYCEKCRKLGAIKDGKMFGQATNTRCTGLAPNARRSRIDDLVA